MLIRPLAICLLLIPHSPLSASDFSGGHSTYRPIPNKRTNPNRYDPWAQSAANQQLIWRDQGRGQKNKRYHQGLHQPPPTPYIPPQFEQQTINKSPKIWEDKSLATTPPKPKKNPKPETWRPLHKETDQSRSASASTGATKGNQQLEILVDGKPAVFRPLTLPPAPD